jgi:hypothetical protein
MTYEVDESSLVRYLATCADEDVIIGDQLVEFCAIAVSFLRQVAALGGAGERRVGEVVAVGLVAGGCLRLSRCERWMGQEQERCCD